MMKAINLILILLITIGIGYCWGARAEAAGVNQFIIGLVGLGIGFFMPMVIMRWLYGEENKQSETEEDSDISKN